VAREKNKLLKFPKDRTTTDSPVLELLIKYGKGTNVPRLMGSGGSRWHPHSKVKLKNESKRGGYSPTSRDKSASKPARFEETPLTYELAKKYLKARDIRPDINEYADWAKGNRFPVGESLVKQARGVMLNEQFKKKQILKNLPFFKEREDAIRLKKKEEFERKAIEEDHLKKKKKFFEDITNNPDEFG